MSNKQNQRTSTQSPAAAATASAGSPTTTAEGDGTTTSTGSGPSVSSAAGADSSSQSASPQGSNTESAQPSEGPKRATAEERKARRDAELVALGREPKHKPASDDDGETDADAPLLEVVGQLTAFPDHPSLGGKELVFRLGGAVTGSFKLVVPYRQCEGLQLRPGDRVEISVKRF